MNKKRIIRKGTDREFCVYYLKLNKTIFYVGKTSIKVEDRLHVHKTTTQKIKNFCKNQINDIKLHILEKYPSNLEALQGEIKFIKFYISVGCTLLNKQHAGNRYIPKKRSSGRF